jgi:hypothetical protein
MTQCDVERCVGCHKGKEMLPILLPRDGGQRVLFLLSTNRLALLDRHKFTRTAPNVNLSGPRDFLLSVRNHFLPLCQPANCTWYRKKHGEHLGFEPHSLVNDSRNQRWDTIYARQSNRPATQFAPAGICQAIDANILKNEPYLLRKKEF